MSAKKSHRVLPNGIALGVGATLALALAACGSTTSGTGVPRSAAADRVPTSIPITAIEDMTGPLAFYGTQVTAGIKAGIAEVKQANLLGGSNFSLTVQDTGGSATTAASLASAATHSGAVAILGSPISNETLAQASVVNSASIPFLAPAAPGPQLLSIGKYVYSMTTPESVQLATYVPSLVKKDPKVTIIYASDNDTTVGLNTDVVGDVKSAGGTLVSDVSTTLTATDFSVVATRALQGAPDAIGIMSGGPEVPSLVTTLRADGFKGVLFANEGADGTVNSAGAAANGFQFQGEWAPNVPGAASKGFAQIFAATNPQMTPYYPAVDGYDEVLFLAQAIKASGSATSSGILKGMQQVAATGFTGPGGHIQFTGTTHQQLQGPTIDLVFQNGQILATSSVG